MNDLTHPTGRRHSQGGIMIVPEIGVVRVLHHPHTVDGNSGYQGLLLTILKTANLGTIQHIWQDHNSG